MAAITETTSVGSNPGRSIRPTPSRRRSAPRVSTSWSDVPTSLSRNVPTTASRMGRSSAARCRSSCMLPWSAHWRSSRTRTTVRSAGEGRQHPHHRGEELEPLGVGVDGPDRRQARQPAAERGNERAELGTPLVDQVPQLALGSVPHVVPERLGEQLVRGAEVLLTVARQDERPVVERPAGHFGHDRALALPGLARHQQHRPSEAGVGALHGRGQRVDLVRAADDADVRSESEPLGEGHAGCRRPGRQRGGRSPPRPGGHARQGQVGRLLEDLALEQSQLVAGLDPLLLHQDPPDPAVHGQGLGLATTPVQGDHELGPEPLAVGVRGPPAPRARRRSVRGAPASGRHRSAVRAPRAGARRAAGPRRWRTARRRNPPVPRPATGRGPTAAPGRPPRRSSVSSAAAASRTSRSNRTASTVVGSTSRTYPGSRRTRGSRPSSRRIDRSLDT